MNGKIESRESVLLVCDDDDDDDDDAACVGLLNTLVLFLFRGSPYGVVANVLNCNIEASEFKLHSSYHVHFQTNMFRKGMKPLIHPAV